MIFGYYKDGKLQYVVRTRNGFTPSSREQLFKKLKPLEVKESYHVATQHLMAEPRLKRDFCPYYERSEFPSR
jgi:ATP-dependent DNA ligase